jgi:hypothetical protein
MAPYPDEIPTLASDLLRGASQLAVFFYGEDNRRNRRRIYHLASEVVPEARPPFFKLGDGVICGRASRLRAWIAAKEDAAMHPPAQQAMSEPDPSAGFRSSTGAARDRKVVAKKKRAASAERGEETATPVLTRPRATGE